VARLHLLTFATAQKRPLTGRSAPGATGDRFSLRQPNRSGIRKVGRRRDAGASAYTEGPDHKPVLGSSKSQIGVAAELQGVVREIDTAADRRLKRSIRHSRSSTERPKKNFKLDPVLMDGFSAMS
jgi:hypothetical protein